MEKGPAARFPKSMHEGKVATLWQLQRRTSASHLISCYLSPLVLNEGGAATGMPLTEAVAGH